MPRHIPDLTTPAPSVQPGESAAVSPATGPQWRSGAIGPGPELFGVYPALVASVVDPERMGRVRIRMPWAVDPHGGPLEAWARLAMPMAGNACGAWLRPEPEDEVLVAFEAGDASRPYVVGSLWNGVDAPPESGTSARRVIRSPRGLTVVLDDAVGAETVTIETPGGQRISLTDAGRRVEVEDSAGNAVRLEPTGISVRASGKVTVTATAVEISATVITVNAGLAKFSGAVQSETLITNSVIAQSYTPGAGNVW